jgi:hypothetical protein
MSINIEQSKIDRQNVLNNNLAIQSIQEQISMKGFVFEDEIKFTREQIRVFFEIDDKTIERYLKENEEELKSNGYFVYKGKKLKEIKDNFGTDINVGSKVTQLGIFNFRAFLDLGMLLKESDKASLLRSIILDVFINTLNQKLGKTLDERKFVNQKDPYFLDDRFLGKGYRKELTDAIQMCVAIFKHDGGKYAYTTNQMYEYIFLEKAKEYRDILELAKKDQTRDTMYSDVLNTISVIEIAIADRISKKFNSKGNQWLSSNELEQVMVDCFNEPSYKPMILRTRRVMASRDHIFRGIDHKFLSTYIAPLDVEDYNRFLHDISVKEIREQKKDELKKLTKSIDLDSKPWTDEKNNELESDKNRFERVIEKL